jgi:hypothetical protein
MVISESGGQLQAAHLAADEQNPEGIYFVSYRCAASGRSSSSSFSADEQQQ